jgi:DNA-binding Xre family transcriptional regulator
MKDRQISQRKLIRDYGFSTGQLDRLRKNQTITTYTLNTLCEILQCRVEDIVEYRPDEPENSA